MNPVMILAMTIYLEAGNQPMAGKIAVAQVVMARVADPRWPDTVEAVCLQPKQFSCWNGRDPATVEIPDDAAFYACETIAERALAGRLSAGDFNHYYNPALCSPPWADQLTGVLRIGDHLFGRMI